MFAPIPMQRSGMIVFIALPVMARAAPNQPIASTQVMKIHPQFLLIVTSYSIRTGIRASYALAHYEMLLRRVSILMLGRIWTSTHPRGLPVGHCGLSTRERGRPSGARRGRPTRYAQGPTPRRGCVSLVGRGAARRRAGQGRRGRNGIARQNADRCGGGDAAAQHEAGKKNSGKRYGRAHGFTPQESPEKLDYREGKSSLSPIS